jgi:peptidoglycan/LPS O-acetylase OafA/YrhL
MLFSFIISYILVFIVKGHDLLTFFQNNYLSVFSNLFLIHSLGIFKNVNIFNTPSWSISVEFYTYFIFAILMFYKLQSKYINSLISILCFFYLFIFCDNLSLDSDFNSFVRCVLGFNLGCVLARIKRIKINNQVYFSMFLLLIFMLIKTPESKYDFIVYLLFSILIIFSINTSNKYFINFYNKSILKKIGELSYSIYMIHTIIIYWLKVVLKILHFPTTTNSVGNEIYKIELIPSLILIIIYLTLLYFISNFIYFKFENYYRLKGKELIKKLNI